MTMQEKIAALLNEYNHANSEYGIEKMLEAWRTNKANLISVLSKHPNWDADNYRIVFSTDYERGFDSNAIDEFKQWVKGVFLKQHAEKINGIDATVYSDNINRLEDIQSCVEKIRSKETDDFDFQSFMTFNYNGEEYSTLTQLIASMTAVFRAFQETHSRVCGVYITDESKDTLTKIVEFFNLLINTAEGNLLTEDEAEKINELFPEFKAVSGQKIMKPVRKLCVKYGLDNIVQMQRDVYTDDNGYIHERIRDKGYNYQIAALGDKINPFKITRHTIVSVNPLDILTMSFGHGWASCHTIDKENKRGSTNHYSGMYCSGPVSYMNDGSSVLLATFDAVYNGTEFEFQDKMQRCMFHINEDGTVIVQGRVYPDGRDGGEKSYATQFRNIMQQIIAQCFDHCNLWTLKKGTHECRQYTQSVGTHYRDYLNYDDCTVSLLKGIENYKEVKIGHLPICPNCGQTHSTEDYLVCASCRCESTCAYCEDEINPEDSIECYDTGAVYCCYDCATADGVHYCEDDDRWHDEDHCYQDSGNDEWYSGCPEVETEDGRCYHSCEAAYDDGYTATDDGEWYPEDEVYYDENREIYFHEWCGMVEHNGDYYYNSESAQEAGLIQYKEEWYDAEDMVSDCRTGEIFPAELDGAVEISESEWYIDDFSAREAGYVFDEESKEWRRAAA